MTEEQPDGLLFLVGAVVLLGVLFVVVEVCRVNDAIREKTKNDAALVVELHKLTEEYGETRNSLPKRR